MKPVAWRAPHWSGLKGVWLYRDYDEPFIGISGNNVGEPLYTAPKQLSDEEIIGAVARGWCSEKNSSKTMDSDLAMAIADEIKALIKKASEK